MNNELAIIKRNEVIENLIDGTLQNAYDEDQQNRFLSEINEKDKKEYGENSKKISRLEQKLFSTLSEDAKEIYEELENLNNINCGIETRYAFKKGIIRGLTDLEYLKDASNCICLSLIKL